MTHSPEARKGFTKTLKAEWAFNQKNLLEKTKTLKAVQEFKKLNVPGVDWAIKREEAGIRVVKRKLATLKKKILRLQKLGDINKII